MNLFGKNRTVRVAFTEEKGGVWEERTALMGINNDGEYSERIAADGGEPEDASFRRDWNWVRGTIQELLDEIERPRGLRDKG